MPPSTRSQKRSTRSLSSKKQNSSFAPPLKADTVPKTRLTTWLKNNAKAEAAASKARMDEMSAASKRRTKDASKLLKRAQDAVKSGDVTRFDSDEEEDFDDVLKRAEELEDGEERVVVEIEDSPEPEEEQEVVVIEDEDEEEGVEEVEGEEEEDIAEIEEPEEAEEEIERVEEVEASLEPEQEQALALVPINSNTRSGSSSSRNNKRKQPAQEDYYYSEEEEELILPPGIERLHDMQMDCFRDLCGIWGNNFVNTSFARPGYDSLKENFYKLLDSQQRHRAAVGVRTKKRKVARKNGTVQMYMEEEEIIF